MSSLSSSDRGSHEEDVNPSESMVSSQTNPPKKSVILAAGMVSIADSQPSNRDHETPGSPNACSFPSDDDDDDDSSELSELDNISELEEELLADEVSQTLSLLPNNTDQSKATSKATPSNPKHIKSVDDTPVARRVKTVTPDLNFDKDGAIELPYQTVKAIKLPPRTSIGPPSENERPYGDTNHMNSMLIYWLDEEGMSYNQATQKYAQMFPENKAVEEAIRRRHIRCLQRLAKKYGVHDEKDIVGVGKNVLRRGKKRAPRVTKVIESSPTKSHDGGDEQSEAKSSPPVKKEPRKSTYTPKYVRDSAKARVIEKLAIVVWKDMEHLSYKEIRNRLEDNHSWSLGTGTIEKYYHLTRPKVYKVISGTDAVPEPANDSDGAGEVDDNVDDDDKDSIMEGLEELIS